MSGPQVIWSDPWIVRKLVRSDSELLRSVRSVIGRIKQNIFRKSSDRADFGPNNSVCKLSVRSEKINIFRNIGHGPDQWLSDRNLRPRTLPFIFRTKISDPRTVQAVRIRSRTIIWSGPLIQGVNTLIYRFWWVISVSRTRILQSSVQRRFRF